MWCVTTRSGLVAWGVAWALLGLGACASGASAPGGDAGSDSAPSDSTGADEGLDGRVDAADDAASDVPPDALPDAPLDGADGGIDAPADAADATTAPPALSGSLSFCAPLRLLSSEGGWSSCGRNLIASQRKM